VPIFICFESQITIVKKVALFLQNFGVPGLNTDFLRNEFPVRQRKRTRKRTRRSRIVEQPLTYSRVVAKKLNPLWL